MEDTNIKNEYKTLFYEAFNVFLLIITIIDMVFIVVDFIYTFPARVENILTYYDLTVCIFLAIGMFYSYRRSNYTPLTYIKSNHHIFHRIIFQKFHPISLK